MTTLIFLDIDGVLMPFPTSPPSSCGALFPDFTLEALTHILRQVSHAKLVLSSTWRAQDTMVHDILDSFRLFNSKLTSGSLLPTTEFYDMTDPKFHAGRDEEIQRYITRQPQQPAAWVALDDEVLSGQFFKGHVVQTQSNIGLTKACANEAIALLKEQQQQQQS